MSANANAPITIAHGSSDLQVVTVDAYNAELRDAEGFIGDRASNRAFRAILDEWRERIRAAADEDPLGDTPSDEMPKKKMDKVLAEGEPEAAGIIQGAIEDFANELSTVVIRFLKSKAWRDTERIVVGGGLRSSRVGELAIGRTSVLLKAAGHKIDLVPVRNHPDEAGLLGAIHLAPAWMLDGHDAILAVDIGGSNLRAGLVELRPWKDGKKSGEKKTDGKKGDDKKGDDKKGDDKKAVDRKAEDKKTEDKKTEDKKGDDRKAGDIARGTVDQLELWRYADEKAKPTREQAIEKLGAMLERLIKRAEKNQVKLAPFIGVGCPGIIAADGHIERGGQNLPGNWESSRFNLPERLRDLIPKIGGHETLVVLHNDAVVHGLSDLAYVRDVEHWGVLTIGTGLGNARFTNRNADTFRK